MNSALSENRKIIIAVASSVIVILFLVWLMYGGEIFTKTSVVVNVEDELFNTTYQKRVDKFVLGLDYTVAAAGITVLITGILLFINKKRSNNNEQNN